jgi:enoyl-CoA hydratase/carnithine racemase
MLLTARALEAHEALKAGLISRVVPSDRVRDEAFHVANTIVSFSKSVIALGNQVLSCIDRGVRRNYQSFLGKSFFYTQIEQNIHTANRNGIATMCENLKYKDAQEGINAFFYKRQPIWTNNSSK